MKNAIEVNHLVKNYKDVQAVRDISFTVEEGSFFAFLGVNGAGKSTTINILCTVLEKTSGSVTIGGFDLDKDPFEIKNLIGIVFQGSVLDKQLTVKDNLVSRAAYYGLSRSETKARVEELTKTFELDEIINRKYDKLSGGQKRRVDIARALLNRPKILFLDEPTTGLDPMTRSMVWEVIHDLQKETGLTVFLTTHYMEETALCDKVVVLDLRNEEVIHAGNRFMIYALYPETQISVHVAWGFRKQNTAVMIGKSIVNRGSTVDIGELCLKYGGGGHHNAGTCQLDNDVVDEKLPEIIRALNA